MVSEHGDLPIMTNPGVTYRQEEVKGTRYSVTPELPKPREK
jgi:hypothetical protein